VWLSPHCLPPIAQELRADQLSLFAADGGAV